MRSRSSGRRLDGAARRTTLPHDHDSRTSRKSDLTHVLHALAFQARKGIMDWVFVFECPANSFFSRLLLSSGHSSVCHFSKLET